MRGERLNAVRGFTLTELMVAVAILVVIVLATGKIFGTASTVSGMGVASENILQDAAAIERQIRADFAHLSHEGIFAIQSHVVPNDVYAPLLINPAFSPNASIRCDQIVFFTTGVQGIQTFMQTAGSNRKGQSTTARVYYGHAFQLTGGRGFDVTQNRAHDLAPNEQIWPWYSSAEDGTVNMAWTKFGAPPTYVSSASPGIDATQPEARRWILARQPVILADDDQASQNEKTVFLINNMSARTILTLEPQVRDGRTDAAALRLNDIRNYVTDDWFRPWRQGAGGQRTVIGNQIIYFPRAERVAPSGHRIDQSLTTHVLSGACSSFIVEWTYDEGVGVAGNLRGVRYDEAAERRWFGAEDPDRPGVEPYSTWVDAYPPPPSEAYGGADTIDPAWIDESFVDPNDGHTIYRAFFGFNSTEAVDPATGEAWASDSPYAYTPWPSAVRITMVLHDPETRLENGRKVQFVVRLPQR
jgi:prepilin-type N-terminal cleavage/methylation domain-containing protein